ncbi:4209_t:CDS:2 [Gigaspora rosea]|nr:4209_t:CDS:2 [Gigaspora rosea]
MLVELQGCNPFPNNRQFSSESLSIVTSKGDISEIRRSNILETIRCRIFDRYAGDLDVMIECSNAGYTNMKEDRPRRTFLGQCGLRSKGERRKSISLKEISCNKAPCAPMSSGNISFNNPPASGTHNFRIGHFEPTEHQPNPLQAAFLEYQIAELFRSFFLIRENNNLRSQVAALQDQVVNSTGRISNKKF